jgi:hypothetical protein
VVSKLATEPLLEMLAQRDGRFQFGARIPELLSRILALGL